VRTLATVRRLALPIRVDLNVAGKVEATVEATMEGKEPEPAGEKAVRPWRLPALAN
jgi:hypothetical protein